MAITKMYDSIFLPPYIRWLAIKSSIAGQDIDRSVAAAKRASAIAAFCKLLSMIYIFIARTPHEVSSKPLYVSNDNNGDQHILALAAPSITGNL